LRKWDCLVSLSEDAELEEIIDDDGFINPKGKRFQVSYQNAVPILHASLAAAFEQIDEQRAMIDELREFILTGVLPESPVESPVESPIKPVKRRIKKIIRRVII
jgi:hypothetical protein